jgi:hypothetical protein
MNDYNTTVFANGNIAHWRLRDHDCNRFKVYLLSSGNDIDFGDIDIDDCDGEEFATAMRLIGQ